jgi:hypothetical protein
MTDAPKVSQDESTREQQAQKLDQLRIIGDVISDEAIRLLGISQEEIYEIKRNAILRFFPNLMNGTKNELEYFAQLFQEYGFHCEIICPSHTSCTCEENLQLTRK